MIFGPLYDRRFILLELFGLLLIFGLAYFFTGSLYQSLVLAPLFSSAFILTNCVADVRNFVQESRFKGRSLPYSPKGIVKRLSLFDKITFSTVVILMALILFDLGELRPTIVTVIISMISATFALYIWQVGLGSFRQELETVPQIPRVKLYFIGVVATLFLYWLVSFSSRIGISSWSSLCLFPFQLYILSAAFRQILIVEEKILDPGSLKN